MICRMQPSICLAEWSTILRSVRARSSASSSHSGLAVNNQFGATEHAAFYTCTGNEYMANRITKAGLAKGRLINLVGSFNPREYQTKTGETRMSLDVGLYDWSYVGGKPKGEDNSDDPAPAAKAPGTVQPESPINDEDDLPL